MKKKSFSFLLSIVVFSFLLVSLTGCGGGSKQSASSENKIVFSLWGSVDQMKVDQQIIDEFKQSHTNVEFQIIHIPSQTRYNDKLLTMLAGGTAPDVMFVHLNAFPVYAESGRLLDLDPYIQRDLKKEINDIYPLALKTFQYKGKQFAFPRDISGWVMFYNKKLFKESGVAYPTANWTWNNFENACKAITKDTNKDGVYDSYGAIFPQYLPIILSAFGGAIFDNEENPTKCLIAANPNNLKAMEWIKKLFDEKAVAPLDIATGVGTHEIFMSGKIGMYFTGRWKVTDFKTIKGFDWDVCSVPKGISRRATRQSGSALAISKDSKNKDLAWEFLKFYTGKQGVKISVKGGRLTPIYKSMANSAFFLNQRPPENMQAFVDTMKYGIAGTKFPKNGEVLFVFQNVLQEMIQGSLTPEKAIVRMQNDLTKIIEDYQNTKPKS